MQMTSLGTLSWKRELQLEENQAQMNLSCALEEALQILTPVTCVWLPSGQPHTRWAAATPKWILSVSKVSFIQVDLLIKKAFLEMPYTARSFPFSDKYKFKSFKGHSQANTLVRFSLSAVSKMRHLIQWRREMLIIIKQLVVAVI